MSDSGSPGSPGTPAPDPAPPGGPGATKIQEVQGSGAWRTWLLGGLVVLLLVVVGLLLWAADRTTSNDEDADQDVPVEESTTGTTTTVASTTTVAPTTVAPTTAASTTAASTSVPRTTTPSTSPPTTEAGRPTTSSPTTTVEQQFEGVLADLAEIPDYSTFTSLLAAAGIYELEEPVTIFAPTNDAFEALPADTLDYLEDPANVDVLTEVLTSHIVSGALFVSDLPTGTTVTTLAGNEFEVTTQGGRLLVGGVPVVEADLEGGDGSVIHGIDGLLVPPGVDLPG